MAYYYSDESRGEECGALPDIDVFFDRGFHPLNGPGYYYQYSFPGCLPESDPYGPYATEEEALEAAREDA